MKTETFNTNRFILLLRRQQMLMAKSWIIALSAMIGAIIFIAFLNLITAQNDAWLNVFDKFGVFAFVVMGLVIASTAFSEMGTYARSLQYITLPASRFEKFFAAWLSTSVIYIITATIALIIGSIIMAVLSVIIFDGNFILFNPITIRYAEAVLAFFVAHTAFFLGAVWFRKVVFFKTLLTMFVINVINNIWIGIWVMLIINPFKLALGSDSYMQETTIFSEPYLKYYVIGYFVLISVFFLYVAWLRFKEREV